MRRCIAVLILVAAAGCSKKSEAPPPAPVPSPARRAEAPAPQKTAPAVWSVAVMTMGGFSGGGKGGMRVSSDSTVAPRCRAELTAAIANADPASWQSSYRLDKPSVLTDQFSYSFTLKLDGATYAVSWKDESIGMLPADLRKLYETLWSVCR